MGRGAETGHKRLHCLAQRDEGLVCALKRVRWESPGNTLKNEGFRPGAFLIPSDGSRHGKYYLVADYRLRPTDQSRLLFMKYMLGRLPKEEDSA